MKKTLVILITVCILCSLLVSCNISKSSIAGSYKTEIIESYYSYELIINKDFSFSLKTIEDDGHQRYFVFYTGTVQFNSKNNTGFFIIDDNESTSQSVPYDNPPSTFSIMDSGDIMVTFEDKNYTNSNGYTRYYNALHVSSHTQFFTKQ